MLERCSVEGWLTEDDGRFRDVITVGELGNETLLSGFTGLEVGIVSAGLGERDALVADTAHLGGFDALDCPV